MRILHHPEYEPQSGLYAVYPSNRLIAPKVCQYAEHIAAALKDAATIPAR